MPTAVVYSDRYLNHVTGSDHPENADRLKAIMKGIRESGILKSGKCILIEPREVAPEEVCLVHDESYVKMVKEFCERGGGSLDEDTVLSRDSYNVALLSVGGAVKACEGVVTTKFSNAFALVRPPGHHSGVCGRALGASSLGFCLFNNVAVAAEVLVSKFGLKRIMILDFDVHAGNGTQEIFYDRRDVLLINLHQRGIYPNRCFINEVGEGDGEGFNVNVPLPPMSGDDVYLRVYDEIVMPIAEQYKPNFVLVSAGFDGHVADSLATMRLSDFGYVTQIERIMVMASRSEGMVAVLEGGYDFKMLARIVPILIAKMGGLHMSVDRKRTVSDHRTVKRVERVLVELREVLSSYWKV
jgi:acetoin utilization deacetylase AcuC-like enzyme